MRVENDSDDRAGLRSYVQFNKYTYIISPRFTPYIFFIAMQVQHISRRPMVESYSVYIQIYSWVPALFATIQLNFGVVLLANHRFFERRTSPEMMVRCVFGGLYPGSGFARHSHRVYTLEWCPSPW